MTTSVFPLLFLVPFKVKPIKLSKAGIPLGVLSQFGVSNKNVQAGERSDTEETEKHVSRNTVRSKDETKEEKKHRKQEIKNDRKVGILLNEEFPTFLYTCFA